MENPESRQEPPKLVPLVLYTRAAEVIKASVENDLDVPDPEDPDIIDKLLNESPKPNGD
jgi:hypothetical protein